MSFLLIFAFLWQAFGSISQFILICLVEAQINELQSIQMQFLVLIDCWVLWQFKFFLSMLNHLPEVPHVLSINNCYELTIEKCLCLNVAFLILSQLALMDQRFAF